MGDLNKSWTIWFTGLHGSGKSTIASRLVEILKKSNINSVLLDGDELRKTLSSDLGYTAEERNEHMRRVADLCSFISKNGVLAVACVASPTEQSREYARKVIEKLFLVYVKCPLEVCERRDVKGHYKKAKDNEKGFENFMSVSLKFEEPKDPDVVLNTDKESIEVSVNKLVEKLKEKGIIKL
jgi:adenylylsulfate kinase